MSLKLVPPGKRKGSKVYYARGSIAGKRFERSLETGVRSIALTRLRDLEIQLEANRRQAPQPTFAEAALNYLKDGGEGRYMAPVLRYLGADTLLSELTTQAIAEAARALYPNVSPATRHRQAVTPMRAVLGHYARGGMRQGVTDTVRTRWLTPEEAEDLIAVAEGPARRLILTLLGTGCRTSEIVKLQVENVNVPTAQAWIADPKNNRPRWAAVERSRAMPALMEGLPAQGAAFLTPKGKPYQIRKNNSGGQFAIMFNKARDDAGLGEDVTPHALRHTWATWYYAATGHNLAALMGSGGWAKTDMAMRYTKLGPADLASRLRSHGWNFQIGGTMGEALGGGRLYAI
jgi:integrase